MAEEKAKAAVGAPLFSCAKCGIPLPTKDWMRPGTDYWCWPCTNRYLRNEAQ